ncbi:hypothetical protein POL68_30765 [Stigmatella sp. ncwal1]|uniref:Uncharacterized protein n=1 Tax=Stigmatella ashevillensis TaxID=2995309 RepID=A0ABT5DIG5_9BACT|nr:hypothetical protein [Stigmatella ashevillena]MDC0712884.1 hypothetical protein [Stigmatella ashevillena]
MNLRHPRPLPLFAVWGLLCPLLLLGPGEGLAQPLGAFQSGNARLLTTDAASVIEQPVLGLQRSAIPVAAGIAVDTSLYADLLLAPNVGLRWAKALGAQRLVLGARYTHFVGASVYSAVVEAQEPAIQRFEPTLSGPTVYGAYGLTLGSLLVQGEARFAYFETSYLSLTGAAALHLSGPWVLIAEVGARIEGGSALRAAAGVRYGGERFGMALGAAYVDLSDPVFANGGLPVSPVLDVSWTFR